MAITIPSMDTLRNIEWRSLGTKLFSLVMDMKVLGAFFFLLSTIYFIGYDTIYRPMSETIHGREKQKSDYLQQIEQGKSTSKQYQAWKKQLQDLTTEMIGFLPTESPKVLAVSAADRLSHGGSANDNMDDTVLPTLPSPHSQPSKVDKKLLSNESYDLAKSGALPPEVATAVNPGSESPEGVPVPGGSPETQAGSPASGDTAMVEKYKYQYDLVGTYPAMVAFVNRTVISNPLALIESVKIDRVDAPERPDPKEHADFPVQVKMTIIVSFFLYPKES